MDRLKFMETMNSESKITRGTSLIFREIEEIMKDLPETLKDMDHRLDSRGRLIDIKETEVCLIKSFFISLSSNILSFFQVIDKEMMEEGNHSEDLEKEEGIIMETNQETQEPVKQMLSMVRSEDLETSLATDNSLQVNNSLGLNSSFNDLD